MRKATGFIRSLAALAVAGFTASALAQGFPTKPITMVVPFGAGSGTDVSARIFTKGLSEELKVPVVVENRPGGAATVGAAYVAKSAPDGYTLLFLGGGSVSKTFRKDLPVDMLSELTPVIQLTRGSMSIIVKSDLPVRSAQEFIELVRKNPGKYNYAWIASTQMMPMEVLKDKAKIQIQGVAYKSSSNVIQAFESGDVIAIVSNETGLESMFQQRKLRFLTYLDAQRNPYMPDVPSAAEAGIGDVRAPFTQAVWAPAKTPADAIARLNAAFNKVLQRPEARDFAQTQRSIIVGGEPKTQSDSIRAEHAYWEQAAKLSNFQPE